MQRFRNKTWKDKHCKALLIKPDVNAENIKKNFKNIEEEMESLYNDFLDALPNKIRHNVIKQAGNYAVRTGTKHVVAGGCALLGPVSAVFCQALALITDVVDGVLTVGGLVMDALDNAQQAYEVSKRVIDYKKYVRKVKKALGDADEMEKFRNELIEDMSQAAAENDCLKARKCILVPYKNKTKEGKLGKGQVAEGKGQTKGLSERLGLGDPRGCCPGQTGHHLLPGSWMKNGDCDYRTKGSGNEHDAAPTVCVEGVTQNDGTHNAFHNALNDVVDSLGTGKKSIEDAINIAAMGHQKGTEDNRVDVESVFGNSDCDIDCIKAQLRDYYKKFNCQPDVQKVDCTDNASENKGEKR